MSPDLKTYEVPLSQGKVALVSGADFDAISAVKWHAVLCSNRWYARRSVKTNGRGVPIYMHRQLLGLGPADRDTVVDHRNGDGLDNQRSNIRIATYGQNNLNIPAARGRSGFRCVYPQDGRFMVRVAGDYLGIFETAVEAAFHANQGLDAVSPGVGFRNDIDRAALLEILLQRQSSLAALIARVNEGSV